MMTSQGILTCRPDPCLDQPEAIQTVMTPLDSTVQLVLLPSRVATCQHDIPGRISAHRLTLHPTVTDGPTLAKPERAVSRRYKHPPAQTDKEATPMPDDRSNLA